MELKNLIEEIRNLAWNTEVILITKYFDKVLSNFEEEKF